MTDDARLLDIFIAPAAGAPMQSVERCWALMQTGLEGDRYARRCGTFSARNPAVAGSRPVSLIAAEAVAECNERLGTDIAAQLMRRNLLVSGVDLKAAIGSVLRIGGVELEVMSTCPPCSYLSRLLGADMRAGLKNLGGVRATVREAGELEVGAAIELVPG